MVDYSHFECIGGDEPEDRPHGVRVTRVASGSTVRIGPGGWDTNTSPWQQQRAPAPARKAGFDLITQFGWDETEAAVKIYVRMGLEGVGEAKESVSCDFLQDSFDLKVCCVSKMWHNSHAHDKLFIRLAA